VRICSCSSKGLNLQLQLQPIKKYTTLISEQSIKNKFTYSIFAYQIVINSKLDGRKGVKYPHYEYKVQEGMSIFAEFLLKIRNVNCSGLTDWTNFSFIELCSSKI